MTTQTKSNKKIQKFFDGEMSEDERFEFEKAFAANSELLEEMRAFEADLIEKYVRGWMNPAEKAKFEKNFLNTEKRREKVEFSRQLINELRQESFLQKNETPSDSIWNRFGRLFLTPKIATAAAFSFIILIFGGWFFLRISEPEKTEIVKNRNSVNTVILNRNTIANLAVNTFNSNNNARSNLETNPTNTPVKPPTPVITPEPKKTPIPKTAQNPVLSLFAGTLRADGKINELNLAENSTGATFRLNLKTVDYQIFQADVTDANGKVIYRSGNLKPRKAVINLFVPAKNLNKGDFRINLSGKNPAGENESAADFQFRVN